MKRLHLNKKLSDKPSEFMREALDDLASVERMPDRYKVEMGWWVTSSGTSESDKCEVCLAGAVMVRRNGKAEENDRTAPYNFYPSVRKKFYFLNAIRTGNVSRAFYVLEMMSRPESIPAFVDVTAYEDSPKEWRRDMNKIVRMLRKAGV